MTLDQLRELCGDGTGFGDGFIIVVVPRKPTRRGIRLTPDGGPIGEVICVNPSENTVARFDAKAVLRWLDLQEKNDS